MKYNNADITNYSDYQNKVLLPLLESFIVQIKASSKYESLIVPKNFILVSMHMKNQISYFGVFLWYYKMFKYYLFGFHKKERCLIGSISIC